MKIHPLFVLLLIVSSCGLDEMDKKAKEDMILSLNEYFIVPNDTTRFKDEIEYDIELSNDFGDWTNPTKIHGFQITEFSKLEKVYQHDGEIYGIAYQLDNLFGHYSFPEKNGSTYLPDSIVRTYNEFSRIYNGIDSLTADRDKYLDNLVRHMKNYVDNAEAPHAGYSNDVTIEIEFKDGKREFQWTAYFDLNRNFENYKSKNVTQQGI